MVAVGNAPELEPEVNTFDSLVPINDLPDLLALIGRPLGPQVTRR